jgi:hypothetical protein
MAVQGCQLEAYSYLPFHCCTKSPGPLDHIVVDLYHRSIVSVIREKLANPSDDQQFHYEPYELFWQPTDESPEVPVYGELYTSAALHKVHRDIRPMRIEYRIEVWAYGLSQTSIVRTTTRE